MQTEDHIPDLKEIASRLITPLEDSQLDFLCRNLSLVKYHPHENITKQGAFVSHCTLVKSGLTKEYMEGPGEKMVLIRVGTPGTLSGLSDIYSAEHSIYSIASLAAAEVFLIRTDCIMKLAYENTGFGRVLLEEFTAAQAFLYKRIFSLGTRQMHGRLADIILYLTGSPFSGREIFGSITRKEIAELCGMSTESVVRLLKEFREDGLISYEGKEIVVKNAELLERLSRIG
jgi:CRP/FNR family transcriptional regulator, polysaccharide utilization system transcription regulator